MIEFKISKRYVTSDGQEYDTLLEAQIHQLDTLIPEILNVSGLAGKIIAEAAQVIDILSTKTSSHPRARKLHKKKVAKNDTETKE